MINSYTPDREPCERCGTPGGMRVEIDGASIYLCETCHKFVRSGVRG